MPRFGVNVSEGISAVGLIPFLLEVHRPLPFQVLLRVVIDELALDGVMTTGEHTRRHLPRFGIRAFGGRANGAGKRVNTKTDCESICLARSQGTKSPEAGLVQKVKRTSSKMVVNVWTSVFGP